MQKFYYGQKGQYGLTATRRSKMHWIGCDVKSEVSLPLLGKTDGVVIVSLLQGPYIGVAFEDFEPLDSAVRVGKRRTGLAIVSNSSKTIHLSYYKRQLVPSMYTQ